MRPTTTSFPPTAARFLPPILFPPAPLPINCCVTPGVGEVIKGWDRGVAGMRVGDRRRLVVPPAMAYGSQRMGPIPANATLDFEVELVNVK